MSRDPIAEDAIQLIFNELETCPPREGIQLKDITRNRKILRTVMDVIPGLKARGLLIVEKGPLTKNTSIQPGNG